MQGTSRRLGALAATNASCLCRGEPKTFFASAKEVSQASEYGNVPTQIASMGEDNYLKSVPRAASSPLSSRSRICPEAGVAAVARAGGPYCARVPWSTLEDLEYAGVPDRSGVPACSATCGACGGRTATELSESCHTALTRERARMVYEHRFSISDRPRAKFSASGN